MHHPQHKSLQFKFRGPGRDVTEQVYVDTSYFDIVRAIFLRRVRSEAERNKAELVQFMVDVSLVWSD